MPSPSFERRSAAGYLRGNILVGVDLDLAIPVSGALPAPNHRIQRSAITSFGASGTLASGKESSPATGYHFELNIDSRELGRLIWPRNIPSPNDDQAQSVGSALLFLVALASSRDRNPYGIIRSLLEDAGIVIHSFEGAPARGAGEFTAVPYVTFEFKVPTQVRDTEERVLQTAHPIRRLNRIFGLFREHGFPLAYEHARSIHISRFGEDLVLKPDDAPSSDPPDAPLGPWIFGHAIDSPLTYLNSERVLRLAASSLCGDGKPRFETTPEGASIRLTLKDMPSEQAAQQLLHRVRVFLSDQHATMLEAFMIPDEEHEDEALSRIEDRELGSIEVQLLSTRRRPFEGDFKFSIVYPKLGVDPYAAEIQAHKIGFLYEQFAAMVFEFSECFERRY